MIIEWSTEFSVGHEQIDSHHKRIIDMMNKLYESVKSGTEESIMPKILQELLQYAQYHFSIEEGWFLVTDYPNSEEHIQQHEQFRTNLSKLTELLSGQDRLEQGLELMEFIMSWFVNHILKADMEMTPYLIRKKE